MTRAFNVSMNGGMFTGLVEDTATISALHAKPAAVRLVVDTNLPLLQGDNSTKIGDSIAVDGVCLTAVVVEAQRLAFDVGPETLAITAFSTNLQPGRRVHLERALRLSDRLGGHLVAGHVDGVGRVISQRADGDALYLRFWAPAPVLDLCIFKGSIAIDGVSLTLNSVDDEGFDVCLIPHTLLHTHLQDLRPGDLVNLESDLIGKYVQRLISRGRSGRAHGESITWDLLKKTGFTA